MRRCEARASFVIEQTLSITLIRLSLLQSDPNQGDIQLTNVRNNILQSCFFPLLRGVFFSLPVVSFFWVEAFPAVDGICRCRSGTTVGCSGIPTTTKTANNNTAMTAPIDMN